MTAFDLIALGDNCIDRLTGAVTADLVGGNGVNVAVQTAMLGLRAAYCGAVGPTGEADGDRVLAALGAKGVDVSLVERRALATSVTCLSVAEDGNRSILTEDFGACAGWSPPSTSLRALSAARHVHIGWLQDGGNSRRALAREGVSLSQDVSVNAAGEDLGVAGLAIAFASLPEAMADCAGARAADIVAQGAKGAVITLGAKGSHALIGGKTFRANASGIIPVDTTGAGDAYIAGFLAARLNGDDVPKAMAAGHTCAAACCGHPGGFPQ
ncbi:MAG: PfkB family carbohydrate kinase [Paracoccaceae bacterium]|jgi:fructoselysine 6-kinase